MVIAVAMIIVGVTAAKKLHEYAKNKLGDAMSIYNILGPVLVTLTIVGVVWTYRVPKKPSAKR